MRQERPDAAGGVAGPLAQLRRPRHRRGQATATNRRCHANARDIVLAAFDHGVTHFDLANNYGPPPGSAESRFGRILKHDLAAHRDELIISTKAGYRMWPGPYGDLGSRKYLLASLDQSLKRMGVRLRRRLLPPPARLRHARRGVARQRWTRAVKSGKAIYAAVSNYPAGRMREAMASVRSNGLTRPVLHQPRYNLFDRWIERGERRDDSLVDVCRAEGVAFIPFSPLDQGMLTDKYLDGIPDDSRAASEAGFLNRKAVTAEKVAAAKAAAEDRGRSGAVAGAARARLDVARPVVASALIGASRPGQVVDCCKCLDAGPLDAETLDRVEKAVTTGD